MRGETILTTVAAPEISLVLGTVALGTLSIYTEKMLTIYAYDIINNENPALTH